MPEWKKGCQLLSSLPSFDRHIQHRPLAIDEKQGGLPWIQLVGNLLIDRKGGHPGMIHFYDKVPRQESGRVG